MATTNINMKKSPITLATEGTYCEDDIKITAALQEKTVTPGTAAVTAEADENYVGLSKVTVNAVSTETKSTTPTNVTQTIIATSGKFLSSVTVAAVPTETKTVTASTSATTVNATSGKFMTAVTVNPTPSETGSMSKNGTLFPASGKLLSSVMVNVPPYAEEVATTSAMTAKLVAANVGHVYKFTGTTDDNYTNGDLYIVEE